MVDEPATDKDSGDERPDSDSGAARGETGGRRQGTRFRQRLFPERRYRLPLKWVLLALMAGLGVMMVLVLRRL